MATPPFHYQPMFPLGPDTWVEFTGVDATEDRALVDDPENHHLHPDKANMEEWRKRILSFGSASDQQSSGTGFA